MNRLAVPIVILLLLLFAGAVWALFSYLELPQIAGGPPDKAPPAISESQTPPVETHPQPTTDEAHAVFDVARIDPQGISVFAGRAAPGSNVTIMGDGKTVGTAQADENGEWTLAIEYPFASEAPKLALHKATPTELRQAAAAPEQPASDAGSPAKVAGDERRSANAVTSKLLKNLEGMVKAARTEAESKSTPTESKKAELEPRTETAEPKAEVAEPKTQVEAAEPKAEPKHVAEEPKVAASDATVLPANDSAASDTVAAVRMPPQSQDLPAERVERKTVPVPITFIFNEATLTSDGKKAAALLLEYLRLKNFKSVTLTGHADERGTEELNMNLSRERLDTVEQFLRNGGYKGELELIPKGESEPFTGVVRSQYGQEELWQLDRRVELIIAP